PIGGSKNIGSFLDRFGPHGFDVTVAGLCDSAEEADFQRGLERAGLGSDLTRADMERLGFYVCVADLEDELIRCLGAAAVERLVEEQGAFGRRSGPQLRTRPRRSATRCLRSKTTVDSSCHTRRSRTIAASSRPARLSWWLTGKS